MVSERRDSLKQSICSGAGNRQPRQSQSLSASSIETASPKETLDSAGMEIVEMTLTEPGPRLLQSFNLM